MLSPTRARTLDGFMAWIREDPNWLPVWQEFFLDPIEPLLEELGMSLNDLIETTGSPVFYIFTLARLEDFLGLRDLEPLGPRPVDDYVAQAELTEDERAYLLEAADTLPALYVASGEQEQAGKNRRVMAGGVHNLMTEEVTEGVAWPELVPADEGIRCFATRILRLGGRSQTSAVMLPFDPDEAARLHKWFLDLIEAHQKDMEEEDGVITRAQAIHDVLRLFGAFPVMWIQLVLANLPNPDSSG
jgi:hypothetical protein